MSSYTNQNDLLMQRLIHYYKNNNYCKLDKVLAILNGEAQISLRIVDWFVTNYAKQKFIVYNLKNGCRFKVYADYKLRLKSYSKKRFDPFCRWDRVNIPYKSGQHIQTTIGQLNFFRWALDNEIIQYIENHYDEIEKDMNSRNSTSRNKQSVTVKNKNNTRKRREELSISATKSVKKENVEIVVSFS